MSEERFVEKRRSATRRRMWRVVVGLLAVAAMGGLVWVVWFSQALAVDRVQVFGTRTIEKMDVRSEAAVRLGQPLIRVDTVAIESRVAGMERVDRVEVTRRWPGTIRIQVVERRPIAWTIDAGLIRALDRYGVDFRTFRAEPKNLVEVVVETYVARKRQQALESSAAVIELLRKEDPGLLKRVRHVRVASKDSVQLVLSRNRTVMWGSAAKGNQKLTVLRSLLKIKARDYDVSAPEQPTTRK